jgi:hypothetical protein
LGRLRTSPKLIPEEGSLPGFGHRLIRFRHFIDGLLALASQPCLPESCPGVSATFTTIAFDDSGLRWLEVDT